MNNDWITPEWLINLLGPFDLDPCAADRMPWATAQRMMTLRDNGFMQRWEGEVWLNPPYDTPGPWVKKLSEHGFGMALLKNSFETRWFRELVFGRADAIAILPDRLSFCDEDGEMADRAPFGVCIAAYGSTCRDRLIEGRPYMNAVLLREWDQ